MTDIGWIRSGTALFAPLIPCEVRVFPLAERAAAARDGSRPDIAGQGRAGR
ncbi:MAG: STAS/SEC14 domain-containing protein [Defluviimonas sp.]|nr:STAS/SEC14 domain-containing protein [Defluviimonas sp.]